MMKFETIERDILGKPTIFFKYKNACYKKNLTFAKKLSPSSHNLTKTFIKYSLKVSYNSMSNTINAIILCHDESIFHHNRDKNGCNYRNKESCSIKNKYLRPKAIYETETMLAMENEWCL